MTDLIVGIGSLILGIWGVRSVLVPSSLPVVTSIDLALSVIILFVLLGPPYAPRSTSANRASCHRDLAATVTKVSDG